MFDNVLVAIIICVFAVLFVAITCLYRNKKSNFDERQLLARNIAFKISFFFLMVYCLICGLLHIFNVKWAGTDVQMFLGIIISFALFLAISILKDAFFFKLAETKYAIYYFFFLVRNRKCYVFPVGTW